MSIEQFIKSEVSKLANNVFVAPDIPSKKMNGAITGMAPDVDPDYVLAIVDTTVFGGAKEGCLFTGERLYIHAIASQKIVVELSEIVSVNYEKREEIKDNGKSKIIESLILHMKNEEEVNLSGELGGISIEKLSEILEKVVHMGSESHEFVSTSQTMPLSMMAEDIKKNYIKYICNFAFHDDQTIDAKE